MIWAIVILAFTLRLVAINQSLWLDEAIGAIAVKDYSYHTILTDFLHSDNHPPFYYLTLKGWTDLFGYSELALRLPSVIFGVLTIYLTYLIAKKIIPTNHKSQITNHFVFLSSLLLATSPFHIYYSQEARMYSMAAFFAALAVYSFIFLLERKSKNLYWILFSLSITALVFTDYVPVFLLPAFPILGVVKNKNKKWWSRFLLSYSPLVFFGILWLPTFFIQTQKGRWLLLKLPGWKTVAGGASFKQAALVWMKFVLGRISFRDKPFYYSLVLLGSLPYAYVLFKSWMKRNGQLIIWFWLVLPLIIGFAASFWFPAFIYFRFVYVIPAFYLLASWGAAIIKSSNLRVLLGVSLLLINLLGWLIYVSEPYQQREQWRQATSFVEERAKDSDIVIFEFPEPFAPYCWYATGDVQAFGATNSISADSKETADRTKQMISGKEGVYYFEYLRDLSDPQRAVEAGLRDSGFEAGQVFDYFPGVGQIIYWTKK